MIKKTFFTPLGTHEPRKDRTRRKHLPSYINEDNLASEFSHLLTTPTAGTNFKQEKNTTIHTASFPHRKSYEFSPPRPQDASRNHLQNSSMQHYVAPSMYQEQYGMADESLTHYHSPSSRHPPPSSPQHRHHLRAYQAQPENYWGKQPVLPEDYTSKHEDYQPHTHNNYEYQDPQHTVHNQTQNCQANIKNYSSKFQNRF